MSRRGPRGFVHEALYYSSQEEFLAAVVPFLQEGLDAGETVAVACSEPIRTALTTGLHEDPRLHVLTRGELYTRPGNALTAQQRFVQGALSAGARRVRITGDPPFSEEATTWSPWTRYESALNAVLADYPAWNMCLYDTRRLPGEVLTAGTLTHPYVSAGGVRRQSSDYVAPQEYLRGGVADPLEANMPVLELHEFDDLRRLRHAVFDAVAGTPAGVVTAESFTAAVNEVVTNASSHGRSPVLLRLWTCPTRSVCVVTDSGTGVQDPLTGYIPAHEQDLSRRRMGLWLARQLCDDVQFITTGTGFAVRLVIRH